MRQLSLVMLLAGLTLLLVVRPAAPAAEKALPPLNQKVLDFATAHKGKKVGNGECWTLADRALEAAGARQPSRNGVGPFDFGRPVKRGQKILPGDVIQFARAYFRGQNYEVDLPQHTAIVSRAKGTRVTLLHQNFAGKRIVQLTPIDLKDLKRGEYKIYRPVPKGK